MRTPAEQRRQHGNLSRLGTVAELDLGARRCRIQSGELLSDWIPWFVPRAGTTIEWSAPALGEQGMLLCPDGDTGGAVFLRGLYSDSFDSPESDAHAHLVRFSDGTRVRYDDSAHRLQIDIAGGEIEIDAPGGVTVTSSAGVTINADTTINGKLQVAGDAAVTGSVTADVDVVGGGISLKTHKHSGVQSGSSLTGAPQ